MMDFDTPCRWTISQTYKSASCSNENVVLVIQESSLKLKKFACPNDVSVGLLFHIILITQRNSILKFYNNLQDYQTQTNKHIITKRVLDYYPGRHGILKTLIPSFFNPWISSLWDPSSANSIPLDLLYYSSSQGAISVWVPWSKVLLSNNC